MRSNPGGWLQPFLEFYSPGFCATLSISSGQCENVNFKLDSPQSESDRGESQLKIGRVKGSLHIYHWSLSLYDIYSTSLLSLSRRALSKRSIPRPFSLSLAAHLLSLSLFHSPRLLSLSLSLSFSLSLSLARIFFFSVSLVRPTHRHTDLPTHRATDRATDRPTHRSTDPPTHRPTDPPNAEQPRRMAPAISRIL